MRNPVQLQLSHPAALVIYAFLAELEDSQPERFISDEITLVDPLEADYGEMIAAAKAALISGSM